MTTTEERWPRRRTRKAVALLVVGVGAFLLVVRLSSVFIPIGIALLLAYILEPVIAFMGRHHSSRFFTVLIFYVLFLAIVAGGGMLIVPPLVDQGKDFVAYIRKQGEKYDITWDMLSGIAEAEDESESASASWWPRLLEENESVKDSTNGVTATASADNQSEEIQDTPPEDSDAVGQFVRRNTALIKERMPGVAIHGLRAIVNGLSNVAGFFTQLVLSLFYAFFFMLHLPAIQKFFTSWLPRSRRQEVDDTFREIDEVVAGFFRGRLLVCGIAATVMSVGLLISGIDFWLLLGIAAGFLGIIPFIGVAITLIPALLIAITSEHSLYSVIGVLATFGVVEGVVDPFVGPFVISNKVRLHPVTVMVAFLAGGVLFGVLGILLAIPACGVLKILARRYLAPTVQSVIRPRGKIKT